jgi:carboxymethylenebutenolidase
VPQLKGGYLIAIASNDDARSPNDKVALREAFAAAKRPAEIEVYADAMHGWCVIDSKVYNPPQAERAWARMLDLFAKNL